MQIGHNTLHRPVGYQAAILHQAPDASICAPVLAFIPDAHNPAIGKLKPARSLDLQKEKLDRVRRVSDLETASRQRAVVDGGSVIILNQLCASYLAPYALAFKIVRELPKVNVDKVSGSFVDRNSTCRLRCAAARDFGLIIARGKCLAIADLNSIHVGGKKGYGITRPCFHCITGRYPVTALRKTAIVVAPNKAGAACLKTVHGKVRLARINLQSTNLRPAHCA